MKAKPTRIAGIPKIAPTIVKQNKILPKIAKMPKIVATILIHKLTTSCETLKQRLAALMLSRQG